VARDIQHVHRAPTTRPYLPSDRILNDTDRAAGTEPRVVQKIGQSCSLDAPPHLSHHLLLSRSETRLNRRDAEAKQAGARDRLPVQISVITLAVVVLGELRNHVMSQNTADRSERANLPRAGQPRSFIRRRLSS
jgi:hypothetical protein